MASLQLPWNYQSLVQAKVACFTEDGEFNGSTAEVFRIRLIHVVEADRSDSSVEFDIWRGGNVFQCWKPLDLYREFLLAFCLCVAGNRIGDDSSPNPVRVNMMCISHISHKPVFL
jgi:hypothetical protein